MAPIVLALVEWQTSAIWLEVPAHLQDFVLEIPEVVSSSLQTQACVDVFLTVSLCESTKPDSNRAGVSTERCNEFEYPRRRSAVLRCDADLLCKVGPGCEFFKAGFGDRKSVV